ncbi:hypothetical protein K0M31_019882 [Melipona bicolor]|uniref:Uncharacterized protein n=1 Tax=Melipona bicolor TaxID=60889 RepID=A0AA40G0N7_9HYME|nr:hypothetical protein K0M31_019882 [Melipona bicolor]
MRNRIVPKPDFVGFVGPCHKTVTTPFGEILERMLGLGSRHRRVNFRDNRNDGFMNSREGEFENKSARTYMLCKNQRQGRIEPIVDRFRRSHQGITYRPIIQNDWSSTEEGNRQLPD